MSQENVEVVSRWFDLVSQGDRRAALQYVDPAIETREGPDLPGAGTYLGHAGLEKAYEHWAGQWAELRIELEELIDSGGDVIAITRHHGTGRASGVTVQALISWVFTVERGKLTRLRIFSTKLQALEAVGLAE
jgi:ketosteroid isomerase-like protein